MLHPRAWNSVPCAFFVLSVLVGGGGCGGDQNLGKVSGTVKLDGQPLPNALVTFQPKEGGSPSAGRTDAQGRYTLIFSRDLEGAQIGEHTVKISTYAVGDEDSPDGSSGSEEKVPAKYNVNSELTREVTSGSQTHDFELDAEGKIATPQDRQGEVKERFAC